MAVETRNELQHSCQNQEMPSPRVAGEILRTTQKVPANAMAATPPTACEAPPGSWCNGTQHIVAAPAHSLAQPPVFAHSLFNDALSRPHEQRALSALAHGGCCCDICTSHCASSAAYNCETCAGAADAQCAMCYYRALNHSHHHGTCYDPPPLLTYLLLLHTTYHPPSERALGVYDTDSLLSDNATDSSRAWGDI